MSRMIKDFQSALAFITILPAGKRVQWSPLGMIKYFPLVGLILGGLLFGFDALVSTLWPPAAVAVLDTVFLVCLTGAFHLDGLGDAADGLFSHRPQERVLEIMKDSRVGMMGLVAVVCILAVKTAGIYSMKINGSFGLVFWVVPSLARSAMIFGIRFLKYGRKGSGTGLDLFERPVKISDFVFVGITVVICLGLGYKGLFLLGGFAAATFGMLLFYKRKLNCITGDMLGAMTESIEALLFLAAGAWMA
jgi:adenosylcobinamide-GDP ribazoletransferase